MAKSTTRAARGVQDVIGTYDTLSFSIAHPGIRHFGREFVDFDDAAHYVFKYVGERLLMAKSKVPDEWALRMQAAIKECKDRLNDELTLMNMFFQSCADASPAMVAHPEVFEIIVQTAYSTQFAQLIHQLDEYCLLLDGACLRADIEEEEYLSKYQEVKNLLKNVISVARKLNFEARSEILNFNAVGGVRRRQEGATRQRKTNKPSKNGPVSVTRFDESGNALPLPVEVASVSV